MIKNNVKNALIQTGYVISTTYVNGVAVCKINSDMSPNLTFTGFFQYLQPGILCNIPNNTKVALAFSPNKHVGGVTGAVNIIPEDNTTLTGDNELKSGEVALVNIDNFNYSIQAKVDSLLAIFKNDSNSVISSTLIGEPIVAILRDIISEFNNVASAINSHQHNAGGTLIGPSATGGPVLGYTGQAVATAPIPPPVPPAPLPVTKPYVKNTQLVVNDLNYLGTTDPSNPPQCFVDSKGKKDIPTT